MNRFIGFNSGGSTGQGNQFSNSIAIGNNSVLTCSNTIQLGDASINSFRCQVALTVTSDERFKKDVEDLDIGLDFIEKVETKKYKWINNDIKDVGFIAQDLLRIMDDNKYLYIPGLVDTTNKEKFGVCYSKLIPILVNCIKDLSERIKRLE